MTASHVRDDQMYSGTLARGPASEASEASDWLAAKTSQLSLVEAGGLALAKEPPDKMQGASNVQPDGWSL